VPRASLHRQGERGEKLKEYGRQEQAVWAAWATALPRFLSGVGPAGHGARLQLPGDSPSSPGRMGLSQGTGQASAGLFRGVISAEQPGVGALELRRADWTSLTDWSSPALPFYGTTNVPQVSKLLPWSQAHPFLSSRVMQI